MSQILGSTTSIKFKTQILVVAILISFIFACDRGKEPYEKAKDLFESSDYVTAKTIAESILRDYPKSKYISEARTLIDKVNAIEVAQRERAAFEAILNTNEETLFNQLRVRFESISGYNEKLAHLEEACKSPDGKTLALKYVYNRYEFQSLSKDVLEFMLLGRFLDVLPTGTLFTSFPEVEKVTLIIYSYRTNEDKYGNVQSKTKIPVIQLTVDRTTMTNLHRGKVVLVPMSESDVTEFVRWAKGLVDMKWY